MVKFNTEELETIKKSADTFFEEYKEFIPELKYYADSCGDNNTSGSFEETGRSMENVFNNNLIPAFEKFKAGVSQLVDNKLAWESAVSKVEPISFSMKDASIDKTIQSFRVN